ncbi:MAG: hypothetical protein ACR2JF_07165 [Iamia sp.]
MDRSAPRLGDTLRAKALRGLTGVLLAFAVALLVRPVLFLTAALGDDDGTGDLWPALAATVAHLVVLALAVSLFRRAR